jgi:hypothetical protein
MSSKSHCQAYEESQKNHREEAHGLTAIAVGRTKKISGDGECNWTCQLGRTSEIEIAHEADYINLQNWQGKMMEDIATLNGDIPSDHHDTGNATTISSEHSISDLNSDHGVEQLSAVLHVQPKVQEQLLLLPMSLSTST